VSDPLINPFVFGAAAFDPLADISWFRVYWADDPSWSNPGNGNAVSSWRDASGANDHVTQGTAGSRPIFRSSVAALNNRGAVEFDGTDDYVASGTGASLQAQPFTVVMVVTAWGASADNVIFGCSGNDCRIARGYPGAQEVAIYAGGGDYSGTSRGDANAHLYTFLFNAASSAIGIDGSILTTAASPGTRGYEFGLAIGAQAAGANPGDATVAFCGVYLGDFSGDTDYAAFKTWCASYYGLTIS
jgi:hypothetical protein